MTFFFFPPLVISNLPLLCCRRFSFDIFVLAAQLDSGSWRAKQQNKGSLRQMSELASERAESV